MNEPRLCCNCLHCARWKKKDGIECHCDLDDRYLGYLTVMDEENDCKHWEKETKWDLEREHDKEIRAEMIDEMLNFINVRMSHLVDLAEEDCRKANTYQENYHRGGLWELGIVRDEVVKLKEQNNG